MGSVAMQPSTTVAGTQPMGTFLSPSPRRNFWLNRRHLVDLPGAAFAATGRSSMGIGLLGKPPSKHDQPACKPKARVARVPALATSSTAPSSQNTRSHASWKQGVQQVQAGFTPPGSCHCRPNPSRWRTRWLRPNRKRHRPLLRLIGYLASRMRHAPDHRMVVLAALSVATRQLTPTTSGGLLKCLWTSRRPCRTPVFDPHRVTMIWTLMFLSTVFSDGHLQHGT